MENTVDPNSDDKCPVCGSQDITWLDSNTLNYKREDIFECKSCSAYFKMAYQLVFTGFESYGDITIDDYKAKLNK